MLFLSVFFWVLNYIRKFLIKLIMVIRLLTQEIFYQAQTITYISCINGLQKFYIWARFLSLKILWHMVAT